MSLLGERFGPSLPEAQLAFQALVVDPAAPLPDLLQPSVSDFRESRGGWLEPARQACAA